MEGSGFFWTGEGTLMNRMMRQDNKSVRRRDGCGRAALIGYSKLGAARRVGIRA